MSDTDEQTETDSRGSVDSITKKTENLSLQDRSTNSDSNIDIDNDEIFYPEWLPNHPWEGKELPDGHKLENIEVSNKYQVDKKWKSGKQIDFKKVLKDLHVFIKELEKPSAYKELKVTLNTPPLELVEMINKETPNLPSTLEISRKMKGESPTQTETLPEQNNYEKYCAYSLQVRETIDNKRITEDVDGYILDISVPISRENVFNKLFEDGEGTRPRTVFIPSYLRASCGLFDWSHTGIDEETTVRIIVVRPSQFEEYVKCCGWHLPIIKLPDDTLGIGYPRYWIQKIATAWGLESIWMIDDSVHWFSEVHPGKACEVRKRNFGEVFKKIEDYIEGNKEVLAAMSPTRYSQFKPGNEAFVLKPPQGAVFLNLKLLNENNITYRPQLSFFEDMLFGAECASKGLKVMRWRRIQLFDMPWIKTGAAVYRTPTSKKTGAAVKITRPTSKDKNSRPTKGESSSPKPARRGLSFT